MKQFIATLESVSRYSQSRMYSMDIPKQPKEQPGDYEARTWRHRCHVDDAGKVFIPPTSFSEAIKAATGIDSQKIPGRRNETWKKHFVAGVMVPEGLSLGVALDEVKGEWLMLNSDGKKGGGSRVARCMPYVDRWRGDIMIHVFDDLITKDVVGHYIAQAGVLVGIGRFRPERGGYYGRFRVVELVEVG